jgi:hypothetical protein
MQPPQAAPMGANAPQMGPGAPQPPVMGGAPPPTPPSPQQVQQVHEHLSELQEMLDKLIKLPDDDLTLKHLYRSASDLITNHRLSDGRKGLSAAEVVGELSKPGFPREDAQGNSPPPQAIRQYLQNQFNQAVKNQALITHRLGPPVQQISTPSPMGNNQLGG